MLRDTYARPQNEPSFWERRVTRACWPVALRDEMDALRADRVKAARSSAIRISVAVPARLFLCLGSEEDWRRVLFLSSVSFARHTTTLPSRASFQAEEAVILGGTAFGLTPWASA